MVTCRLTTQNQPTPAKKLIQTSWFQTNFAVYLWASHCSGPIVVLLVGGGWYWTACNLGCFASHCGGPVRLAKEYPSFECVYCLFGVVHLPHSIIKSQLTRIVAVRSRQQNSLNSFSLFPFKLKLAHANLQLKEPELSMKILIHSWAWDSCACPLQNIRLLHPSIVCEMHMTLNLGYIEGNPCSLINGLHLA